MEKTGTQRPERKGNRNRLQFESSPYLRQHADNPVNWFAWSDEAFRKAVAEDKPVFLSIGYSSCHWCHVMEDESFRDPDVAALLNQSFVSVKVDREERPDIDQSYMAMAQMVTGQGGWPLTVIMAPDGKPFFLGTYIPKLSGLGRAGLLDLLPYVSVRWSDLEQRAELLRSATSIVTATQRIVIPEAGDGFPEDASARAFSEMVQSFDAEHGGFGRAPKFPTPERLRFLIGYWRDHDTTQALSMVTKTLNEMRQGGIYDHIGSGFHRYSVDDRWAVPHFEKMLYDQALLAEAYLDAYLVTGDSLYASTVRDTLGYVQRQLQSPEGGFYCAEDADTAEGEGAYYLWTLRQLRASLDAQGLRVVLASAGIQSPELRLPFGSRFSDDEPIVLSFPNPPSDVAPALSMSVEEVENSLRKAQEVLHAVRESRERVMVDEKVSADWNGLAISAFARAGRALGYSDFIQVAERAADLVMAKMMRGDVLMHTYKDGVASVPGFLEDYAYMAMGLLQLFQAGQRVEHLRSALHLVERMVALFADGERGGFYQSGGHREELVVRTKPVYDGALPSGNAIAGKVLAIVARLTERADLAGAADRLFTALSLAVSSAPGQFPSLLMAHRLHVGDTRVIVVVGEVDAPCTRALLRATGEVYAPDDFVVLVPPGKKGRDIAALLPVARGHAAPQGVPAAFICNRSMCMEPLCDAVELRRFLSGPAGRTDE